MLASYAGRTGLTVDRIANAQFRENLGFWFVHGLGYGALALASLWLPAGLYLGWGLFGMAAAVEQLSGREPTRLLDLVRRRPGQLLGLLLLGVAWFHLLEWLPGYLLPFTGQPANLVLGVLFAFWTVAAAPFAAGEVLVLGTSAPRAFLRGYQRSAAALYRRLDSVRGVGIRPPAGEARLMAQGYYAILLAYVGVILSLPFMSMLQVVIGYPHPWYPRLAEALMAMGAGMGLNLGVSQASAHYLVHLGERRRAGEVLELPES